MGLSGIFLHNSLETGIGRAEIALHETIEEEVLQTAVDALQYAKDNAPWEDRSGDARAGLDVNVEWRGEVIIWEMFHSVDYGLYLETRWNGKFAIIMPTLEQFAPQIGNHLSGFGDGNYG